jgi:hypothetical protein
MPSGPSVVSYEASKKGSTPKTDASWKMINQHRQAVSAAQYLLAQLAVRVMTEEMKKSNDK